MAERLRDLALVGCDLYVVAVLLAVLGGWLTAAIFWPFTLMSNFLPWLLLPTLLTGIIAVMTRQPVRIALNAAAVLVFVAGYGVLFVPRLTAPAEGTHLRLMTFNTYGNAGGDPQEYIDMMAASEAHIIALQEVHTTTANLITAQLGNSYPHQALYPVDGDGIPGVGVISRYPIIEHERFYTAGPLPHVRAVLDVNGQPVTVFSVHPATPGFNYDPFLHYDASLRSADVAGLVERVTDTPNPTLLMGDFNMTRHSNDWRTIHGAGFRDAYLIAGQGYGMTYPSPGRYPLGIGFVVRIDYIFVGQGFGAHFAWVDEDVGADHKPVFAEVVLEGVDP